MYAWIWRKLPFGLAGKLTGSIGLALGVVALLWFVAFPWAEPIMPFFNDGQVGTESGDFGPGIEENSGTDTPSVSPGATPTDHAGDDFDVPYDEESNNPSPTRTR